MVTASDLVKAALQRIDTWQGSTNAFSQIFAEEARASASEMDRSSSRHGRLAGVPIAVKDLFAVRGHTTSGCCAAVRGGVAEIDAALVALLRREGAIVIGKTNQHELAAGVTNLESSCGPTRNPWDATRMSGGSSGGSAIAVSVGIVRLSLGSDTGGSGRIPASFCGCWGLKPTHGRLPIEGMMPLAPSLDCPSLLAATLGDLTLGWEILSGRRNPHDRPTVVGLLRGGMWDRCHVEVRAAIEHAALTLRSAGVDVREIDGSTLEDAHSVWNRLAWPEFAERYATLIGDPSLGSSTASLLEWGLRHQGGAAEADVRCKQIGEWFADTFREVGLLLTATTPYVAPIVGAREVDLGDGSMMDVQRNGPAWFTEPINLAGVPAVAVPFATSSDGLPVSVQLIGPRDAEEQVFAGAEILRAPQPDLA